MFAGQRCQRTSEATDDVSAVPLDLSRGAQLFVHHFARPRHPCRDVPRRSLSPRQFVSELFASLPKHRLQLICRQPGSEYIHQLSQERDVRARQQLLDVGRQFEDVRRPRRAWTLTCPSHDTVAFHAGDLRPNGAARYAEFGGDVISR